MAKTSDVIDLLRLRYPLTKREWAHCVEFQNIDFLAVNTWPSKHFVVHGHEIKVSRSDWKKELSQPGKAIFTMPFCDFWWLVAPTGIAKYEEVPDRWGLMEITPKGLRVVVQATRL